MRITINNEFYSHTELWFTELIAKSRLQIITKSFTKSTPGKLSSMQ